MTDFIKYNDPEKLQHANEANYQSYVRTYATVHGNLFLEDKKAMLCVSREDGISMVNNSVAKTLMSESDVSETLDSYKKAGKPVLWAIFPSAKPVNIKTIFKKKRLMHLERNALMYLDMTSLDEKIKKAKDIVIKEVDSLSSLEDWATLNAVCFSMTRDTQKFITQKAADLFLDKTLPARHYIAYRKNKPVGTSSVYLSDGVTGIYNVTTAPQIRGRGIGEALTKTALIYGKKAGYSYAILQATRKGLPVYKKMGFRSNKHMDYYVKYHGRSILIIPLNHLILTIGNFFKEYIFIK